MTIELLDCEICGKEFACDHELSPTLNGQKVAVPHCWKCGWHDGKCPDKHGVMCEDCQNIGGAALAMTK